MNTPVRRLNHYFLTPFAVSMRERAAILDSGLRQLHVDKLLFNGSVKRMDRAVPPAGQISVQQIWLSVTGFHRALKSCFPEANMVKETSIKANKWVAAP